MKTRTQIILLCLLVLAVALRAAFGVLVVGLDTPPKADEADYHVIAAHLAAGDGYVDDTGRPTGRRAPGYPALLSVLYRVTGPSPRAARILQFALGGLVMLLAFAVARRHFGEGLGLVTAALVAVNPFLIFVSGYALSENLYVVLVLLALVVLPRPVDDDLPPSRWFFGAVVLALATLVRPGGLLLAAWIVLASLVAARSNWTMRIGQFLIMVLVLLAVLLPWAFRNQSTFGRWVGLTTHGGITFYQGNNQRVIDVPQYRGGVAPLGALPHFDEIIGLPEAERDEAALRLGVEWVRGHPGELPRLEWWKFRRFWRLRSDMGLSGIRSGWWFGTDTALGRLAASFDAGFVYAVVVFPLMIAGIVLTRRRWRDMMFLYGVIASHTAVALVFFGSLRGRVPVEPVMALFAAVAIAEPVIRRARRGADA